MRKAVFEFQLLTPTILAGADQHTAEMRIPSIRGALRWWTRLLAGEDEEKNIFGYVKGKECHPSTVTLRLLNESKRILDSQNTISVAKDKFDYFLWPLNTNLRGGIQEGSRFKVAVQVKPGCEESDWLEFIIKAFLLFGSLGTRSRRAYGSVWPISAEFDGEKWDIPQTLDELLDEADTFLEQAEVSIYSLSDSCRDYAQAIKKCSAFLKKIRCGKDAYGSTASKWGKSDHDAGLQKGDKIYRVALGLPLSQKYSSSKTTVNYSIKGFDRMASPLHFKIVKLGKDYVPLMLVIPEYVPESGTIVNAKEGKGASFTLKLDNSLLNILRNNAEVLSDEIKQLAYYPMEDE